MRDLSIFASLVKSYKWPKATAVTGALGSGKTEWVLNLALGMQAAGESVTIADVDIINPYFCIRQVSETLEAEGFKVLTAPDRAKWADMPLVTAKVDWALSEPNSKLIMDIGGDAEGALALKQYEIRIKKSGYLLVLVVNAFRPDTSTISGIGRMLQKMEDICGLKVGALISNSHLMQETTVDDAIEGLKLVKAAGVEFGLPVLYAGVPPRIYEAFKIRLNDDVVKAWPVSRYMLLPWERGAMWSTGIPSKNRGAKLVARSSI